MNRNELKWIDMELHTALRMGYFCGTVNKLPLLACPTTHPRCSWARHRSQWWWAASCRTARRACCSWAPWRARRWWAWGRWAASGSCAPGRRSGARPWPRAGSGSRRRSRRRRARPRAPRWCAWTPVWKCRVSQIHNNIA